MPAPPARTEQLDAATARWLVTAEGRAARATAARALASQDVLSVTTMLRGLGLEPARTAAAMDVAEARRRLPDGLAAYEDVVFTRSALEQASDPAVSAWRARRYEGRCVADLGCGAGGDLLQLAVRAGTAVGVERDEARAVLARHNLSATGRPGHVVVADALRVPLKVDAVHADPSRRVGGRRARHLAEYGPAVPALLATAPTGALGIVVSPGLSWSDPDLPATAEVEFLQREAELVEAILWLGDLRDAEARATATIVAEDGAAVTRSRAGPVDELDAGPVGRVVVEVAPAAVRARLHDELGATIGARRLARSRALLTVDEPPPASPWWRAWHVEAQLPARPKAVRAWLRGAPQRPLEIATSGYDADPQRWWRALGRPPRGPQGRRLLLVRLDQGSVALALTPCADG